MRNGSVAGTMKAIVACTVAVAVVVAAGPVRAEDEIVYSDEPWPGDLSQVSPSEDAFHESRAPNKGVGFLASVGSIVMSAVTFPVKMVVGVTGAVTGGVAGGMNGGDEEAAAGIWNVSTDGSYFVSPEVLEGRKPFRLTGDHR